jgi:hypothetical protein
VVILFAAMVVSGSKGGNASEAYSTSAAEGFSSGNYIEVRGRVARTGTGSAISRL